MLKWTIPSSSGRDLFSCTFVRECNRDYVVAEVKIAGAQLERDRSALVAVTTSDYEVVLRQVVLRNSRLELFSKALEVWLESRDEITIELSEFCGQRFQISIGAAPDLISSKEKPAFVIRYSGGAIRSAEWAFVVDQSCLRICNEELNAALASLEIAAKC